MPSAFEMGLHGQAEQGLHALGVSLMAAEMAELQAIRLERTGGSKGAQEGAALDAQRRSVPNLQPQFPGAVWANGVEASQ